MAAPTQQFPPWLTNLPTTVTDADGVLTTSTTIVFLPLTYYGPSIPLDSDWTYGGLTSPASSASSSAPTTTSIPVTTTSAIPSTSITTSSPSSATPSPTATPTSPTSPTSISSSSVSPSSSPLPASNSVLSKNAKLGIILGSIFGVLFALVVAFFFIIICRRRIIAKRARDSRFNMVTPPDDDYMIVGPGGRTPGEGSPRGSGEEADSFLRQRGDDASMQQTGPGRASVVYPSRTVDNATAADDNAARLSASMSSHSSAETYGSVLHEPTLSSFPRIPPDSVRPETPVDTNPPNTAPLRIRRGPIVPPGNLMNLEEVDEPTTPPSAYHADDLPSDYSSLTPPPRLDPDFIGGGREIGDREYPFTRSQSSLRSSFPVDADEAARATLLTGRRVRVSPIESSDESSSNPRWLAGFSGLGMGRLSMGRHSWFNGSADSSRRNSSHRNSRPNSSYLSRGDDLEDGQALLGADLAESRAIRELGVGYGPSGERPLSNTSARSASSGTTVYHDALSSTGPNTPMSEITPLPRAFTGSDQDNHTPVSVMLITPLTPSRQEVDVLDLPAPSAIHPFASASSSSLSLSATTSANTTMRLGDITSSKTHPPPQSMPTDSGITIDVLEEAPPSAGEGWRSLAGVMGGGGGFASAGRRTTFGLPQFVHPNLNDPTVSSEQGSLHSMRSSHLSPHTAHSRSTGSAPASSRHELSSSMGSSAASARSGSAKSASLSHSPSISSDGRRRGRAPALSAFGRPAGLGFGSPSPPSSSPSPQPQRLSPLGRVDIGRGAQDDDAVLEPISPNVTGLQQVPWAGGLDGDWTPA